MAIDKKIFGTAIFSFLIALVIAFGLIIFFKISKRQPAFAAPKQAWNHYKKKAIDEDKETPVQEYGWSYFMSEPDCLNACIGKENCNTYSFDESDLSNSCKLYDLADLKHLGDASAHNTGSTLTIT